MSAKYLSLQQDGKDLLNSSFNVLKQKIRETECFDKSLDLVYGKMIDETILETVADFHKGLRGFNKHFKSDVQINADAQLSDFSDDGSIYEIIPCPNCGRTMGFSVYELHLQKCLNNKRQKFDCSPTPEDDGRSSREEITRGSRDRKKRGEENVERWSNSSKFMNLLGENQSKFISPKGVIKRKNSKLSAKNIKIGAGAEKQSLKKVFTYDSNSEESESDLTDDSRSSNSELKTFILAPIPNSKTPLTSPLKRKKSKLLEGQSDD